MVYSLSQDVAKPAHAIISCQTSSHIFAVNQSLRTLQLARQPGKARHQGVDRSMQGSSVSASTDLRMGSDDVCSHRGQGVFQCLMQQS